MGLETVTGKSVIYSGWWGELCSDEGCGQDRMEHCIFLPSTVSVSNLDLPMNFCVILVQGPVWNNTVIWRCLGGSGGCNHRPTWCHYTHYTVKINAKIHITPSSIMPEGTSKVQNAVKYDPMIHISPSSMIPWYTLHLQVWSHDTHYTVKHEPMIHITPSSMNPWYTLHRQAWSHDTHYTVKHEPMIQITPSSMSPWYTLHLQAWA